jgi:hypothetical protein
MNFDSWTPENPTNVFPGINRTTTSTDVKNWGPYFNASYVRLQDVTLMYALPVSKWSFPIAQLEAYVNIKNAYTFTSWPGMDPEYDIQSGVPRPRSYILGLRVSF